MTHTPGPEQGQPDPTPGRDEPVGPASPVPPPPPTYDPAGSPPAGWESPGQQPQPGWQPPQPDYAQLPPQGWQPAQGGYGQPAPVGFPGQGYSPAAPYGIHPGTGLPYSDKTKLIAGLLQILVPFGVGRFYTGFTGIGVAQLVATIVTCGFGGLWSLIDGILILVDDAPKDAQGRILKS